MPFALGMPTLLDLPDVQANVDLCRQLGLGFVELNMNLPSCMPHALDPMRVQQWRFDAGLDFTVHLPEELDLACASPAMRQGHLACAIEALTWAGRAGAELAVMHLHTGVYFTLPDGPQHVYARDPAGFLSRLCDGFDRVMLAADAAGVRLCIENTGDWSQPFPGDALQALLDRHEDLGLCYDVGHDYRLGCPNQRVFVAHADRLAHMHLHDVADGLDHQPLFTGIADTAEMIMLARGRDVRAVVEVKTPEALEASVSQLDPALLGRPSDAASPAPPSSEPGPPPSDRPDLDVSL